MWWLGADISEDRAASLFRFGIQSSYYMAQEPIKLRMPPSLQWKPETSHRFFLLEIQKSVRSSELTLQQSVSQSASQSVSQPASQSVSQPVSQSASQSVMALNPS
jgi:hypothetical protein